MIKQIWICECDICGHSEKAKAVSGRYNEPEYTMPSNWQKGYNDNIILCPECAKAVYGNR